MDRREAGAVILERRRHAAGAALQQIDDAEDHGDDDELGGQGHEEQTWLAGIGTRQRDAAVDEHRDRQVGEQHADVGGKEFRSDQLAPERQRAVMRPVAAGDVERRAVREQQRLELGFRQRSFELGLALLNLRAQVLFELAQDVAALAAVQIRTDGAHVIVE